MVYKYLKKHKGKVEKNQLDLESVIQILKMKDLHAFAASILEIMVGQNTEHARNTPPPTVRSGVPDHIDTAACHEGKMAQAQDKEKPARSITGAISLDTIPLNWSKYKEVFVLIEIIQLCYSPNNNGKRINTTDTL